MKVKKETFLILDNIRSSENVGSIFRTADAASVSKIYLCGYTPSPKDRFGRVNKKLIKASLGAERTVAYENISDAQTLIQKLKNEKVVCVAIEQDERAIDYKKIQASSHRAFVFGNEVEGISMDVLKKCNAIVEIPMHGKKESLNVAVAVGIVLFSLF